MKEIRNIIRNLIKEVYFNESNKTIINEKLGVPNNIIETSILLYDKIIDDLNDIKNVKTNLNLENKFEFSRVYSGDFQVSDYSIKDIHIKFSLQVNKRIESPILISMAFSMPLRIDYSNKQIVNNIQKGINNKKVNLSLNFGFNNSQNLIEELIVFLEKDKNEIISSLSHELKHSYDKNKKPRESFKSSVKYKVPTNLFFGIRNIDIFLHNLYFTHAVENLVRPTEIATMLKLGRVNKKDFINFLKSNKTYSKLKEINNFEYFKFKELLIEDADLIRNSLKQKSDSNVFDEMSDKEIVDHILKIVLMNISRISLNEMENLIGVNFLIDVSDVEYLNKYKKEVKKYGNNYDKFFEDTEKMFKLVSSKLIKKIHKLYDMIEDKEREKNINSKINSKKQEEIKEEIESKSIKDWDLNFLLKGIKDSNYEL